MADCSSNLLSRVSTRNFEIIYTRAYVRVIADILKIIKCFGVFKVCYYFCGVVFKFKYD